MGSGLGDCSCYFFSSVYMYLKKYNSYMPQKIVWQQVTVGKMKWKNKGFLVQLCLRKAWSLICANIFPFTLLEN